MSSAWQSTLDGLREKGLERVLRTVDGPVGARIDTPQGPKLLFCSNDYLGLASHPSLRESLCRAAEQYGVGAAASRLVSGNYRLHDELERRIATFVDSEDAVLFPSGYQANVGGLSALVERGDVIFSDELVHASIVDGCRLSRASVNIFRHKDMQHLEALLDQDRSAGRRIIVTDAIFSMDGDLAPLTKIHRLADKFGALIYLDEAHSLGIMGPNGRGLAAAAGLSDRIAIRVGTLGKAFGVSGAFIACDRVAARVLRSRARSLMYTTAAPPPLAAAAITAVDLVCAADKARVKLKSNISSLRVRAKKLGLELAESHTAIQPVIIGRAEHAVEISNRLWDEGIFVQAIRPPTVPPGTSRLRITLSAAHEKGDIDLLLTTLFGFLKDDLDKKEPRS